MSFINKLFNSIACLLSFTNLQLVIPGRTWILLYLGRTVYKCLWACLALYGGPTDMVINAVQSSKSAGFAPKQFRPSQFYGKPREPQLVPGTDGSLKQEIDCNYCKDLGHLKYNCPKLKEKEARMAGHWDYNKSKKEN